MPEPFIFSRKGRRPRTLAVLIAIYAVLIAAVILVDASGWLMGGLALLTLPALRDLYLNPSAGVRLEDAQLDWHSGRRHGSLSLAEIERMRFDTRWDFSVRVTAMLRSGKRVRLPDESLPPHRTFEAAFEARGIPVERQHFRVF